jgi:hypothetical protein
MSRVPSIQWFGVFCGIALVGCSNATPPQPKPEPPKAAVVATNPEPWMVVANAFKAPTG